MKARLRGERPAHITGREGQVLDLLALGNTNKQIGVLLGISHKTVKNHITHAFSTLGVTNRREAAATWRVREVTA